MRGCGSLVLALLVLQATAVSEETTAVEEMEERGGRQRLMEWLLDPRRYNLYIRPVYSEARPTVVQFRMQLYQILDVVSGSSAHHLTFSVRLAFPRAGAAAMAAGIVGSRDSTPS